MISFVEFKEILFKGDVPRKIYMRLLKDSDCFESKVIKEYHLAIGRIYQGSSSYLKNEYYSFRQLSERRECALKDYDNNNLIFQIYGFMHGKEHYDEIRALFLVRFLNAYLTLGKSTLRNRLVRPPYNDFIIYEKIYKLSKNYGKQDI